MLCFTENAFEIMLENVYIVINIHIWPYLGFFISDLNIICVWINSNFIKYKKIDSHLIMVFNFAKIMQNQICCVHIYTQNTYILLFLSIK